MNLKQKQLRQIIISDHALERAKQRFIIPGTEVNSMIYEIKLKEIIQTSEYKNVEGKDLEYELIYLQKKYKIISTPAANDCILIVTIIPKN